MGIEIGKDEVEDLCTPLLSLLAYTLQSYQRKDTHMPVVRFTVITITTTACFTITSMGLC